VTPDLLAPTRNAQVACQLGYLYNREPVLQCLKEQLVDGVALPVLMSHVTALKDVTTLTLAPAAGELADAAAGGAAASADHFRAATHVRFACPLTGALAVVHISVLPAACEGMSASLQCGFLLTPAHAVALQASR
jgi:hypothetical protein